MYVGLASHWPCVTDSLACERELHSEYSEWYYGIFTFYITASILSVRPSVTFVSKQLKHIIKL